MTNAEFNKGDVVKLKSGGPKMTIGYKTASKGWMCNWFVGEQAMKEVFGGEQLEKAE